jgi:hypothetical protein
MDIAFQCPVCEQVRKNAAAFDGIKSDGGEDVLIVKLRHVSLSDRKSKTVSFCRRPEILLVWCL